VLTQTSAPSTSAPWTWWPAPLQPLWQPTPAERLSLPVYLVHVSKPSVYPTYELVLVPRRPPLPLPAYPPLPYRM